MLIGGQEVLVNEGDEQVLNRGRWKVIRSKGKSYVARDIWSAGRKGISYLHRELLGVVKGREVDHVNGNGLDNRRDNLRIVTHTRNAQNCGKGKRGTRPATSRYKGVSFCRCTKSKPWRARIRVNGTQTYLGCWAVEEEAARAYDEASLKYHGEHGRRNFC